MYLPHFFDLAQLPEAELGKHDVAHVNLACAVGLPGAEHMDPDHCERAIADMTEMVREATERNLRAFRRDPGKYRDSEAYFRALVLITVLQRDCGVRYDPAQIDDKAPFAAANGFVFGIFQGDGGTCGTMPVLYASVGRRLGYPLSLVTALGHLFARWDGGNGEMFNIEATNKGLSTPPDDYYRQGQYAAGAPYEDYAGFLRPLSARRTLAGFLSQRGVIQWNAGYCRDAAESFAWAAELDGFPASVEKLAWTLERWETRLIRLAPPKMPAVEVRLPGRRFALIPAKLEGKLITLSSFEDFLTDPDLERRWWAPMRRDPNYISPDFRDPLVANYAGIPRLANGRTRSVRLPHV